MDIVIPIVFPNYRISVEIKKSEVDVFPWFDFDNFSTPTYKEKISNLGHAGVLFINGKTGTTKYYEYGRYDLPDKFGIVLKARNLPDAKVINGQVDKNSLKKPLSFISRVSGQSGRIEGVYIEVNGKYNAMLRHAELRKSKNSFRGRKPYDLYYTEIYYGSGDAAYKGFMRIYPANSGYFDINKKESYVAWDGDNLYLRDDRYLKVQQ